MAHVEETTEFLLDQFECISGKAEIVHGKIIVRPPMRSENDFGASMEIEIAQKRADYFAAGTLVVWDVDPFSDDAVV